MSNKFSPGGRALGWDAYVRAGVTVCRAFFLTNYSIRIIFTYGTLTISIYLYMRESIGGGGAGKPNDMRARLGMGPDG